MTGNCPHVIFATPTLSHKFSTDFQRSMQETQWLLGSNGITSGMMVRPGDAFVDKARNKLVGDFLRDFPETENFFFLDDDIGWEPAKVLEFIRRPDPVLAGAYPKKSEELDWPCSFAFNQEDGSLYENQGLVLAILAPTGFMRIKRHVLELLASKASTFTDQNPDGTTTEYPYIFECGRGDDGKFWGEDYTFCRKLMDNQINVWIDPNITFQHQGIKTWKGRLAPHMDQFRSRAKAMKEGRFNPETGMIIDGDSVSLGVIREQWALKRLNSAAIMADPETRGKFVDVEEDFWPLYDKVHDLTMTPIERLYDLHKSVEYVVKNNVPGAIVECGVWRGGSMMMIAETLLKLGDRNRTLQLFDTFEGLPYPEPVDVCLRGYGAAKQWSSDWARAGLAEVQINMKSTGYEAIEYHKGLVEETLSQHALEQYALVRLDTDWYSSTKVELEVLWDRIAPGGFLIIDDFGHWMGCKKAVDEFFADKPVKFSRVDYSCRTIQKIGEPLDEATRAQMRRRYRARQTMPEAAE